MSNGLPPDQRPPRLRDDEPIALLVAFLAFGTIFGWVLSQGSQSGFDVSTWTKGLSGAENKQSPLIALSPGAGDLSGSSSGKITPLPVPGNPTIQKGKSLEPGTLSGEVAGTGSPTPSPTGIPPTTGEVPAPPASAVSPSPSAVPQDAQKPPLPTVPGAAINFSDVPKTHPAYLYITALSALGVLGGFPDGSFKPDQPVTRAEYAVQLQKAFTKPDQLANKSFTDVKEGYWGIVAIDKAVKSDFMSGYPDATFRPEQQVSRLEALISMVRGLSVPLPADPEAVLQQYPDQDQVPKWARSRMAAALQSGLFASESGAKKLNANQPATRADIAGLVYKGLQLAKQAKPQG